MMMGFFKILEMAEVLDRYKLLVFPIKLEIDTLHSIIVMILKSFTTFI
jgi:hypothetical protein